MAGRRTPIVDRSFMSVMAIAIVLGGWLVSSTLPSAQAHEVWVSMDPDSATAALSVSPETAVPVVVETADRERIRGAVTSLTPLGLQMETADGVRDIAWSQVRLRSAQQIMPRVINAQQATDWLVAGAAYREIEGGTRLSENAFERALRLDASLAERVEVLRNGNDPEQAETENAGSANGQAGSQRTPSEGEDGESGPQTVGELPDGWPAMTKEQHEQFFEHYDTEYREHLEAMGLNYRTLTTDNFVVYSDLDPASVRRYTALLEGMYSRLVDMFSLEDEATVYAGKAFIFICRSEETYHAFHEQAYGRSTSMTSLGVCWQFGSGRVQISAWYDPDDPRAATREDRFLHTLIHENVHGFLFRYRSPERVPSWANEGLADWVSEAILEGGFSDEKQRWADRMLRDGEPVELFFRARQIEAWQYGLAYGITEIMIRENRTGYRDFIHGIKDGTEWSEALSENFGGVTPEGLIQIYKREQRIVR